MMTFVRVPVTDIHGEVQAQMKAHAQMESPKEACGFVVEFGPETGGLTYAVQCRNAAKDPMHAYEVHEDDLKLAYAEKGWRVVGMYHSHPRGPAEPSHLDAKFAPPDTDLRYFIVTPGIVTEFQMKEGS
jgi:proteasome lid subunit RPN8/RPN11